MTRIRLDSWPIVLPNDDGIRPAGKDDECYYCHCKIGQSHNASCCTVESLYRFGVYVDGNRFGHFDKYLPSGWEDYTLDYHMNEKPNWRGFHDDVLDEIRWDSGVQPQQIDAIDDYDEACDRLEYRKELVLDAGPFVTMRETA